MIVSAVAIALALASCSGGQSKVPDAGAPVQSMIPDQPKDDGQGIGKFKDVALAVPDTKKAESGKALFTSKQCNTCHKVTAEKLIGPGLKGITERRQPAWILNMMTNPTEMTQRDPTAKDLLAQIKTQMTDQKVTDDEALQLLEYLRSNDGAAATAAK